MDKMLEIDLENLAAEDIAMNSQGIAGMVGLVDDEPEYKKLSKAYRGLGVKDLSKFAVGLLYVLAQSKKRIKILVDRCQDHINGMRSLRNERDDALRLVKSHAGEIENLKRLHQESEKYRLRQCDAINDWIRAGFIDSGSAAHLSDCDFSPRVDRMNERIQEQDKMIIELQGLIHERFFSVFENLRAKFGISKQELIACGMPLDQWGQFDIPEPRENGAGFLRGDKLPESTQNTEASPPPSKDSVQVVFHCRACGTPGLVIPGLQFHEELNKNPAKEKSPVSETLKLAEYLRFNAG